LVGNSQLKTYTIRLYCYRGKQVAYWCYGMGL